MPPNGEPDGGLPWPSSTSRAVERHAQERGLWATPVTISGTYIDTDLGFMWHVPLLLLATSWIGDKRVRIGVTAYRKEDLLFLRELIETGEYRAVIDRTYPMEDVIEASRYAETGQKTGNVVLTVGPGGTS